ncbi:MAG: hypothetical protein E6Q92_03580 [Burkholderiaceae bacterium]|nr:MAG: hypothetical protein E6Q92_03580 [Burkholderiaceae bacterium]
MQIHFHDTSAGAEASKLTSRTIAKSGSAAFLDIHYHGSQVDLAEVAGGIKQPGSAAFLDIHYHGSQAIGAESAEAGGLVSSSSLVANAVRGSAAPAGVKTPGSAAFLDIHYHGKEISAKDVEGKPGLHIGSQALLDIHYHG